jgi:hypothetical protein
MKANLLNRQGNVVMVLNLPMDEHAAFLEERVHDQHVRWYARGAEVKDVVQYWEL